MMGRLLLVVVTFVLARFTRQAFAHEADFELIKFDAESGSWWLNVDGSYGACQVTRFVVRYCNCSCPGLRLQ